MKITKPLIRLIEEELAAVLEEQITDPDAPLMTVPDAAAGPDEYSHELPDPVEHRPGDEVDLYVYAGEQDGEEDVATKEAVRWLREEGYPFWYYDVMGGPSDQPAMAFQGERYNQEEYEASEYYSPWEDEGDLVDSLRNPAAVARDDAMRAFSELKTHIGICNRYPVNTVPGCAYADPIGAGWPVFLFTKKGASKISRPPEFRRGWSEEVKGWLQGMFGSGYIKRKKLPRHPRRSRPPTRWPEHILEPLLKTHGGKQEKITETTLKQLIKEILDDAFNPEYSGLNLYTPEEILRDDPMAPPGFDPEVWETAKRRCVDGETWYCPHKRSGSRRGVRWEEEPRRSRRGIEYPVPRPPVPVQWYPKVGALAKVMAKIEWCDQIYDRHGVPARGERGSPAYRREQRKCDKSALAAAVGSDFIPIFKKGREGSYNLEAWTSISPHPGMTYDWGGSPVEKGTPGERWAEASEFDDWGWHGAETLSLAREILQYRHGIDREAEWDDPRQYAMSPEERQLKFKKGRHPMSKKLAPWLYDVDNVPDHEVVGRHMARYPHYAEYLLEYYLDLVRYQGGDANKKPPGISSRKWNKLKPSIPE